MFGTTLQRYKDFLRPSYVEGRAMCQINHEVFVTFYDQNKPFYCCANFDQNTPITINNEGHVSCITECYFQSVKFHNPKLKRQILQAGSGREALEIARQNRSSVRQDWQKISKFVMLDAVLRKIVQNQHNQDIQQLIQLAQATNLFLVENAGQHDAFWGSGADWTGENNLGRCWRMALYLYLQNPEFYNKHFNRNQPEHWNALGSACNFQDGIYELDFVAYHRAITGALMPQPQYPQHQQHHQMPPATLSPTPVTTVATAAIYQPQQGYSVGHYSQHQQCTDITTALRQDLSSLGYQAGVHYSLYVRSNGTISVGFQNEPSANEFAQKISRKPYHILSLTNPGQSKSVQPTTDRKYYNVFLTPDDRAALHRVLQQQSPQQASAPQLSSTLPTTSLEQAVRNSFQLRGYYVPENISIHNQLDGTIAINFKGDHNSATIFANWCSKTVAKVGNFFHVNLTQDEFSRLLLATPQQSAHAPAPSARTHVSTFAGCHSDFFVQPPRVRQDGVSNMSAQNMMRSNMNKFNEVLLDERVWREDPFPCGYTGIITDESKTKEPVFKLVLNTMDRTTADEFVKQLQVYGIGSASKEFGNDGKPQVKTAQFDTGRYFIVFTPAELENFCFVLKTKMNILLQNAVQQPSASPPL